jgi:S-adenosylmethionine hydrolase
MGRPAVVTLTTDFGTADGYVAAMKGVILSIAPGVHLVDISHEVTPHDVREAAFVLYTACSCFPHQTVHMAVVDPGVGGGRRALAVRTAAGTFVGPDNGVFTYVMERQGADQVVEIAELRYALDRVSGTFHGRDVFAPAAAHLASGTPLDALGPPIDDPVLLDDPLLEVGSGQVRGEVLHIDRFGNAITSIGLLAWSGEELRLEPAFGQGRGREGPVLPAREAVTSAGEWEVTGIHRTYAEAQPGQPLALVGSGQLLEIALREGSGARELGLEVGAPVVVHWS